MIFNSEALLSNHLIYDRTHRRVSTLSVVYKQVNCEILFDSYFILEAFQFRYSLLSIASRKSYFLRLASTEGDNFISVWNVINFSTWFLVALLSICTRSLKKTTNETISSCLELRTLDLACLSWWIQTRFSESWIQLAAAVAMLPPQRLKHHWETLNLMEIHEVINFHQQKTSQEFLHACLTN